MDLILVNDNETTGFPRSGLTVEGQARICQMALILCDTTGKTVGKFSTLIKPNGWKISEGAQKVHGITDEQCEKYGMSIDAALHVLWEFSDVAKTMVAHSVTFDRKMIEIELAYQAVNSPHIVNGMKWKQWHCTMENNRHINDGKNPNLDKTLRHYCGRGIPEGEAHDALFDAQACKEIYFASRSSSLGVRQ